MEKAIKIGVSACLVGEKVRYDGGHKLDRYLIDTLGSFFTLIPLCPEVESGMPAPREAMRLEGDPAAPRLMTRESRIDRSEQMLDFCTTKVRELEKEELCGFIFKKGSPSSGLYRVKVYHDGKVTRNGRGLFAASVAEHFPLLPLEEDERLYNPHIRENFIERVIGRHRWREFLANSPSPGKLATFHTCHKLTMMAHSPGIYREMGALVARGSELSLAELLMGYEELYMKGLALLATIRKNTNVLRHAMGYLKKQLPPGEKRELVETIARYHDRLLPLHAPLNLLRHYVNKYDQPCLKQQVYLYPHPAEPMLRNHL